MKKNRNFLHGLRSQGDTTKEMRTAVEGEGSQLGIERVKGELHMLPKEI